MAVQGSVTDIIGKKIHEKYSEMPGNSHIQHFYMKLGLECAKMLLREDLTKTLEKILKKFEVESFVYLEWGILVFLEPGSKYTDSETKVARVRENLLDMTIRHKLKKTLQQEHSGCPIHILLTRACLYYRESSIDDVDKQRQFITTDRIGEVLDDYYSDTSIKADEDAHFDHFYLFVQGKMQSNNEEIECSEIDSQALQVLKDLPGDWKSLQPQQTWGGVFFGYFPKRSSSMTERQREARINGMVRIPLIMKLEEMLGNVHIQVIISRACKYTNIPVNEPATCQLDAQP